MCVYWHCPLTQVVLPGHSQSALHRGCASSRRRRAQPSVPGLQSPSFEHAAPPPLLEPLLDPLLLEPPLDDPLLLLEPPLLDPPHVGSSTMLLYRIAVNVSPSNAISTVNPLHVTALWNSWAYGVAELHPGSSKKSASVPGVTHFSKITMCPTSGPGWPRHPGACPRSRSSATLTCRYGANSSVTRPGGGSCQAHETKPEQSER